MTKEVAICELQKDKGLKDSDLISRAEVAEISEVMLKTVKDQKIKIGISRLWQQIKDLPSADRQMVIKCKPFLSEEDFKAFAEQMQVSDQNVILISNEAEVVSTNTSTNTSTKSTNISTDAPADRPKGRWHYSDGKPATIGQSFGVICDQCGTESEYCTNFCGECGADMRGEEIQGLEYAENILDNILREQKENEE